MSSVTSEFAQVARRVGYFVCTADVSGYTDVSQSTVDYNSWNANITNVRIPSGTVLEDMGELAKVNGYILRKVRNVSTIAAGGGAAPIITGSASYTAFIVVPGGEYPMAGVSTVGTPDLRVAIVARLG